MAVLRVFARREVGCAFPIAVRARAFLVAPACIEEGDSSFTVANESDYVLLECIIEGLDLCFDDAVWVIDNFTLDVCAFGP